MALYLIGLGLTDEKDITIKGLETVQKCDLVYLEGYTSLLQTSKKNYILEITNLVNEGEKLLKSGKTNDFGRLLHESWLLKKSLSSSISNSNIDDIYNDAILNGAVGGKLLGAGGGGFFLFYISPSKHKAFIKHFKKLVTIPFNFTSEGSKILFKKTDSKIIL